MNVETYFRDRLRELESIASRGDPWIFLCASSFIEYLGKMAHGGPIGLKEYKEFLRTRFFTVCPQYGSFKYASGKSDLADQMYHVLRCGIVHSFSVFADAIANKYGGRDRSILLAHRKSASGRAHLDNIVNRRRKPPLDAALLVAEDFVDDIAKVTDDLFAESRRKTPDGRQLRKNIQTCVSKCPPIGFLIL